MNNTNYYVSGSTVRKLGTEPARREHGRNPQDFEEIRRRKNRRNAARRNREKAMSMGHTQLLFLSVCVLISAVFAGLYIQLQSKLAHNMREIASLESRVTDLRADNDAKYKSMTTSIDLESIKEIAINELGMKYATGDQIVYYSVDKNNFMDQYQDIPE